jgi:hypothetical protein
MDERVTYFSLWWTDCDEDPWTAYAYRDDDDEAFFGYGRTKREALDNLIHSLTELA